jgi:hypothetical protein
MVDIQGAVLRPLNLYLASLPVRSPSVPLSLDEAGASIRAPIFSDRATAQSATLGDEITYLDLQCYDSAVAAYRGQARYRLAADDAQYTAFPTEMKLTTADGKKFVAYKMDDAWAGGARGNGVIDDYAALQAYIWVCGYFGQPVIIPDTPDHFPISAKLVFKTTRDLTPSDTTPANDVHFTDLLPFSVNGFGKAKIKATVAMDSMFEFIFDTADSDVGPFYTTVFNIELDGNSLATTCIASNYTMHMSFYLNRLHEAANGISYTGYGGARIEKNTIRCTKGINMTGGGGDTVIQNNDFYSPSNASACIYFGYYGGNTVVTGNTFTNEGGYTTAYAVQMAGSTAAASEEIRDIKVLANEFCGMSVGVKAAGKASGNKNIWRCIVAGNHVTPFGASNIGMLIEATDCTDFEVYSNFGNGKRVGDASTYFLNLTRCDRFAVYNNNIGNYTLQAMILTNCTDSEVYGNRMYDIGKSASGFTFITVFGSSSARNRFHHNLFNQSSASYAQNGIQEDTGVDTTYANDNEFVSVIRPYIRVGANSVMRRVEFLAAAPVSTYHDVGDLTWNTGVAAAGVPGWVCTTAGSPGTFKAMAAVAA